MIRLYIYKIFFNNYQIDIFINQKKIKEYQLENYKDFNTLIQNKELINIYKIADKVNTLKNDNYEDAKEVLQKYKKEDFKKKIKKNVFIIEDIGIDNFYIVSYNLALTNLQINNSDNNNDFYDNICVPLFKEGENKLLLKAIQLFYEPNTYNKIKESNKIDSKNIKVLLFGYRFCLNEISNNNTKGIYLSLYNSDNIKYLKEKFYPGNSTKLNEVYSNIINHFKYKPNEGCYVCLCEKGYYHSIPAGFPEKSELDMKCPKCSNPICDKFFSSIFKNNSNYHRIFKDKNEIEEIKNNKNKLKKLKDINYLTLQQYKEKYFYKTFKNEKGVYITDQNTFKNDEKVVRNLSPISYRLLNYILYSHLFFARLLVNKNQNEFDKYLPKGMAWTDTLNECWNLLKNELLKENIDSIEKFMFYIFVDLFNKLSNKNSINDFNSLIEFEDELEKEIQNLIKQYKEESKIKSKYDEDCTSFISLLKGKYTSEYYKKEEFPFYDYWYYSDYLDEIKLHEKLNHIDENKYPVLKKYLDNILKDKSDYNNDNSYSSDNLNLFNKVLNLINGEYFNNISRENAKKQKLKDVEIYINNNDLFDKFIKFYNNLEMKDNNGKIIILTENNSLSDFFLDEDNPNGRTYKDIYETFIKEQNENIESLLDIKIEKGIFNKDCKNKINIQSINEKEIFNLNLSTKISFIDILFNSSYRKILDSDTRSYELYNEYEIDYDFIEENMTDSLLKNKKLLNKDITNFIYNNEAFINQLTDFITIFKKKYKYQNIDIYDKLAIFKFYEGNKNNINICKNVINDFITLIQLLNNKRKEGINKENDIPEESKIYEVLDKLKDQFSDYLIKIVEKKDGLTIDKTFGIFDYYLKLIYEDVRNEIGKYQKKLDNDSINLLNNYYQKENLISKKDFAYAIRLFITLILLREEDKENKIKNNQNNIVNYLKSEDLWNNDIYDNEDFNKNLNELKSINVQVSQIIYLYDELGKDIEGDFLDDVKEKNKKEKSISIVDDIEKNNLDKKADIYNDDDNDKFSKKSDTDENDDHHQDDDDKFPKKNDNDEVDNNDDEDEDDKFAKKDSDEESD